MSAEFGARRAVFVDRDGTLNREIEGALASPEQLELAPDAARALASLSAAGFALVVVTNQSAIAQGWLDHERLARVHRAIADELALGGARIDLFVACPHHDREGLPPYRRACACRKPQPGMLHDAARRLGLDLQRSWLVGDALRDLAAARAVGARTVLVATGKGARELERARAEGGGPELYVADLAAAASAILAAERADSQGK
ncbi:MAG: HAD-IIIA family hydrolase [Planctomycetes bacterium]|nr:HAD-IIIA family hydrolase [Planctomycetota bacterium]